MKNCYLRYSNYIFLQLVLLFGFSSCSNDDDGTSFPLENVTGEWYQDYSDESKVNFVYVTFSPDGQFTDREVNIGLNSNYDMLVEGTYKYDGKTVRILSTTKYDPRQYYQEWRVNNVKKYTLDITDEAVHESFVFHRVVDTYKMNVGDSRQWSVNDASFSVLSYFSTDEKIASVDENGMIHANKRGTVFVRGLSATEEAVIKVEINDSDMLIDDFTKYIGCDFDNLVQDYGTPLYQSEFVKGGIMSLYDQFDDYIKDFAATYLAKRHVHTITADFRDRADIQPIIDSFDAKYGPRPVTEDYYHFYVIEQDDNSVSILIDEKGRTISYNWRPNGLEEYDGIVAASIDDVAKYFDYDLSEAVEGLYFDVISYQDNPIYSSILMQFDEDTREILAIQLGCRSGISEEEVREWLADHYKSYTLQPGVDCYISGNTFLRSEYHVMVSTNSSTGKVSVAYFKNK